MLTIRAMSDGKGYAARYLAQSDYYAEGERVVGQWKNRGAELLGLSGAVQTEDFEAVREGLSPGTGEFLRQRHSADRVATAPPSPKPATFTTSRFRRRSRFRLWRSWAMTNG